MIKASMWTYIKRYFIYGLLVIVPTIVTIWFFVASIQVLSRMLSPLFGHKLPFIWMLLLSIVIVTLVGMLSRLFIGRTIVDYIDGIIAKIPIIRTVYTSVQQLVGTLTIRNKHLSKAVLIEYPRPGVWAMAFITQHTVSGLYDASGQSLGADRCAVFVPTTPNPTSGFFLFVKKDEIIELSISVEQSMKMLISAGILTN
ncbi:hypothetical protein CL648_03135 [bacterium]|mgnify:FL=1|jgi:uncharacterized membrane protein|nr:hypothetical protein [bacterium]|tara:strand:+ start:14372 stop:14968 length:597 start_codon:yes stop_codon:yes gene_type:complete